jgi:hypothetical protein
LKGSDFLDKNVVSFGPGYEFGLLRQIHKIPIFVVAVSFVRAREDERNPSYDLRRFDTRASTETPSWAFPEPLSRRHPATSPSPRPSPLQQTAPPNSEYATS